MSVFAACALIALKLGTGLATHSLGLVSEAIHSGTDLVAALLTFFAVGVAVRPADTGHQYGHGKAEHLAALAEAAFLAAASVYIAVRAMLRLTSSNPPEVNATWWALLVVVRRDRNRRGADGRVDACRPAVRQRGPRLERTPLRQRSRRLRRCPRRTRCSRGTAIRRETPWPRSSSPSSSSPQPAASCAATSMSSWTARRRTQRRPRGSPSLRSSRRSSYGACGCARRRVATSRTS